MNRDALKSEGGKIREDLEVLQSGIDEIHNTIDNQNVEVEHPFPDEPICEQPPNHEDVPPMNNNCRQQPQEGPPLDESTAL